MIRILKIGRLLRLDFLAAISVAAAVLFSGASPSCAQESYNWQASYGDWFTASNWGGAVPTNSDLACVADDGVSAIAGAGATCYMLVLGGDLYRQHFGTGTVQMSGGSLLCLNCVALGSSNIGVFNQSGGATAILSVDSDPGLFLGLGSPGIYNLSGNGTLSAPNEYLGVEGPGIFNQSGGTNTVLTALYLGSDPFTNYHPSATYNLSGGTLIVPQITKGSGTAVFNFSGGTIEASNSFAATLPITLSVIVGSANFDTADYLVDLSGLLSGTGTLNKLGGGTLELSGGIAATGPAAINLNIEAGKTILRAVNVNENDFDIGTGQSATFEVADGAHTVGSITGSGTTQIDAGASLTAASIAQGTLTLGAGATLTIEAISGGPTGGSITPVPEPSALALLCAASILFALARRKKSTRVESTR